MAACDIVISGKWQCYKTSKEFDKLFSFGAKTHHSQHSARITKPVGRKLWADY